MAESFGVEDRGHFYDPVGGLRDDVVNHLMQVLAGGTMDPPAGRHAEAVQNAKVTLWSAVNDADPAHYVRGQYEGYRAIKGVKPDSTTETYAALRLEIDNWRWSGVPIFVRAGKRLPVTQTEFRLVFKQPPRLGVHVFPDHHPEPDQLVIRLDPAAGMRVHLSARSAEVLTPEPITMEVDLTKQGGEVPRPYEVLLHAAMVGDGSRFARQDGVEERWRIMQPLLDAPPPVHPYAQGSWGPAAADELVAPYGWHKPWI
jgi:glucose-6-phosphate 1-dehydrogenase